MTECATGSPRLLDLRLDKSITQDDYDKKARELKEQQAEIATPHRAAPARRRRVSHNAGKPDFTGFSGR